MMSARRQPSTARGQLTRSQLLQAAELIFAQSTYANASIADITRRAGVGMGTFYVYYSNKETLFLELVDILAERLQHHVLERTQEATDRLSRLKSVLRGHFEFTAKYPHFYRLIRQAEDVDPARYRAIYERLAAVYANELTAAMDEGSVARANPEVLAYMLMGTADFVSRRFVVWTEASDWEHAVDDVVAFVARGLEAPPTA